MAQGERKRQRQPSAADTSDQSERAGGAMIIDRPIATDRERVSAPAGPSSQRLFFFHFSLYKSNTSSSFVTVNRCESVSGKKKEPRRLAGPDAQFGGPETGLRAASSVWHEYHRAHESNDKKQHKNEPRERFPTWFRTSEVEHA